MIDDSAIRSTANTMLKRHGDEAIDTVVAKVEEAVRAGDDEGCALWLRIAEAIDQLLLYRCGATAVRQDIAGPGTEWSPGD
jgi:hypothetical protein